MKRPDMHNPNRLAVLRAIIELYDESYGMAPSLREVAERAAMGWTSTSMVHEYARALVAAGYLLQRENVARGLIPTDAGRAFLAAAALREGEQ